MQQAPQLVVKNPTDKSNTVHIDTAIPYARLPFSGTRNAVIRNSDGDTEQGLSIVFSSSPEQQWIRVMGALQMHAKEVRPLFLDWQAKTVDDAQATAFIPIEESPKAISIKSNALDIKFSKSQLAQLTLNQRVSFSALQINAAGRDLSINLTSFNYRLENNSVLFVTQKGAVFAANDSTQNHKLAEVSCRYTVWLKTGLVRARFTLTNPRCASHPDGKWDLGDPNSLLLKKVTWEGTSSATSTEVELTLNEERFTPRAAKIEQLSSGKPNWQSPIHAVPNSHSPFSVKGWLADIDNKTLLGEQAAPTLQIVDQANTIAIQDLKFAECFPSELRASQNSWALSWLGSEQSELQELQPGEQYTRELFIGPPAIFADVTLNNASLAFCAPTLPTEIDKLVAAGVEHQNDFFAKRDKADCFGWRHFGELYADHESLHYQGDDIFISHYNNQYDPIFGMLKQWLKSGDSRWFALADELARHVADIDIYHTEEDKPDYAGGLFWHTDHYVQAYTATHRTYSKHQPSDVYEDHAGGGGPGGQHCYTSGLLLHYRMTGYEPSRIAFEKMLQWIMRYYETDGTLVGWLFAIKNSRIPGYLNAMQYRFPLDRGTGNYIQALLDGYEFYQADSFLKKAAMVINQTIGPEDNFAERDLFNIESAWFYTVFLQAVCRFLALAPEPFRQTKEWRRALQSLLHFAKWMVENEYAYLDKPEKLEFPNQTWSAQDCRKLCVLSFVKPLLNSSEQATLEAKFNEIKAKVTTRLTNSDESTTTRILCLLLQNGDWQGYAQEGEKLAHTLGKDFHQALEPISYKPIGFFTKTWEVIGNFSFAREKRQLLKRFPQLKRDLNNSAKNN